MDVVPQCRKANKREQMFWLQMYYWPQTENKEKEEKGKNCSLNRTHQLLEFSEGKKAYRHQQTNASCGAMMCQTRFHKALTQSNKLFMMYHIFDQILMAFAISFYTFAMNKCSFTCAHKVVYTLQLQSSVELRLFMTRNSEPWIVLNSFVCFTCSIYNGKNVTAKWEQSIFAVFAYQDIQSMHKVRTENHVWNDWIS